MVEKLLCRFQERCRGTLWDSDRLRNCFLRSRIVLELLFDLQAWLINRFFVFHGRFGTVLWVPRLV